MYLYMYVCMKNVSTFDTLFNRWVIGRFFDLFIIFKIIVHSTNSTEYGIRGCTPQLPHVHPVDRIKLIMTNYTQYL